MTIFIQFAPVFINGERTGLYRTHSENIDYEFSDDLFTWPRRQEVCAILASTNARTIKFIAAGERFIPESVEKICRAYADFFRENGPGANFSQKETALIRAELETGISVSLSGPIKKRKSSALAKKQTHPKKSRAN